jgi:hypothetical protein
MSFEELKEIMVGRMKDGVFKESIVGMIDCYEQLGFTVEETMDKLGEALMQNR